MKGPQPSSNDLHNFQPSHSEQEEIPMIDLKNIMNLEQENEELEQLCDFVLYER